MALITWSDDFSVGVKELDEQHKTLINIINELFTLYTEKKFGQADVSPIFKALMDYADQHLATEEYYFNLYNYEKGPQHTALHNAYREKISALKAEYEKDNSEKTLFAVNNFLNEWWVWHINHVDKEYTEYFNANGLR